MPKKALASLNVVINAVTSPLFRGLKKASRRLQAFGAQMQSIGRSITHSFALPFAAIGAAGAKMAIDFEKNMTKINTLVGISGKEVQKLSQDVMALSGQTAQAPAELAEGLFFLTSAGLRGANAMEALEAVSKGVAVGLGEQSDLAKVAAAAQNAYGEETISAAEALDVFAGAVKEGMFEASDLAEVLGTQLGMAASLGISFQEANAFIATYTKTTGDARSATTSFGGVMMALAKTTPKMEKALMRVGLSGNIVREMLGEQGLMQTLINIKTAFEDNNVPLTDFFSKSQALKGVLGVLGEQTDTYASVLDGLNGSIGNVDEGFSTLEDSVGFKMQKAFNNLKLATQDLGTVMLPIFTDIVDLATKLAKGFTELDSGTKKIVVATAALVALSGPLMTLAGGLVKALGLVLTPAGLVAAALGAIFYVIYNNWPTVRKIFVDFVNYIIDLYNEVEIFRVAVAGISSVFLTVLATAEYVFGSMWSTIKILGSNTVELFGGVGDVIAGALKGGTEGIAQMAIGFSRVAKGMSKDLEDQLGDTQRYIKYGQDLEAALAQGVAQMREKVEFITEDDIQGNVDDVEKWIKDKFQKVKDLMKDFMSTGGVNLTPKGEDPKGEDPEGTKNLQNVTNEKLSIWQKYWNDIKAGTATLGQFLKDHYQSIMSVASNVIGAIGALWNAEHEKRMTIIQNEQTAEQDAFDADYEREVAALENAILTNEERQEAETELKEKYADKQKAIDDKFEAKRKAAQKKQAQQQKDMNIANAIMATAQGVVQALALGPIVGPPLAIMMGVLGAAQISAIASTPIPMAEGGIAFGPTHALVGEYPGAASDPEVVAPLSKLKSMLGNEMNVKLNVGGIVKGNDIYLSNESTSEQRPRYI